MDIESAAPPCNDAVVMDALNARLRATPVDADCLVAALLLLVEQRGISGVARSCGMSNTTFRRQFRNARDLPLSTLVRVLQAFGMQLRVETR
jgi:DNA-binding phage protein